MCTLKPDKIEVILDRTDEVSRLGESITSFTYQVMSG